MWSVDAAAVQLAWELDGLPLALSTAGAYLDNVATTFAEYLEMYRKSWLRLQKTTPGLLSYENLALYSTWDISYAQIEQQNTTSARLLRLWVYFGNEDLWFELLLRGRLSGPQWFRELTGGVLNFTEAIRVLCDYGLVEADTSSNGLGTESRDEWILHALGNLFLYQGRLSDAEAMYERALRGYEKALGREHTSTLNTVNNLGNLYNTQGRLSDAEAMYERALRGYEKALGPEHTSTVDTVNNLGNIYVDQGRLGDAEAMYERALRGYEKALGPEHTDAKAMYKRALRGYEKALGPEDVNLYIPALNTIQSLAKLYTQLGNLSEARVLYLRCQGGS
ncbi:TPR-like protein [Parathielavia appendiculata]|uniref:TPR-like protein n=1 Tax=Parathielavia appendiculata TaxID=2587402 RepID=A0AAN6YY62_9PEZI|nr:TPR-like protein [Parathielavia appendiculata]